MLENHLRDIDFVNIRFIDYELKWTTIDDFLRYARSIKRVYERMNYNQKQIYKWYCYANIHSSLYQKDVIWDFLNDRLEYAIITKELKHNNYKTKLEGEI